jgi:hypothetical protein
MSQRRQILSAPDLLKSNEQGRFTGQEADEVADNGSNRRLELELCASWVVHRIRGMLKS